MSNDSMSTDPKRVAEAKRLAGSVVAVPRVDYNPKAIFRAAYERWVDPKYASHSFDECWAKFGENDISILPVVGALTEVEYTQYAESVVLHFVSRDLLAKSEEFGSRAEATKQVALYSLDDRLGLRIKNVGHTITDLQAGVLRRDAARNDREDGDDSEGGVMIPMPENIAKLLSELMSSAKKR